ncbi:MAG: hypothetical protein V1821_03920 [bacterium]
MTFEQAFDPYKKDFDEFVAATNESPDKLREFMKFATTYQELPLRSDAKRGEQVLIWGEACGLIGLPIVEKKVREAEATNYPLHVMVSGGEGGHEDDLNEIPGPHLARTFYEQTGLDIEGTRLSVDAFSEHTGHQAMILGAWFKTLGTKEVGVVEPLYHISRFLLTLGYACKNVFDIRPRFYPLPSGTWESTNPGKVAWREDQNYTGDQGLSFSQIAFEPHHPRFRFDDPKTGHKSELERIARGWNDREKLIVPCLKPAPALEWFGCIKN